MYSTRYGQPCMTNIPGELGREIYRQIINSPKPDDEAMRAEAIRLEKEMIRIMEQTDAERASKQQ
jgi:hypothetical protein